MQSNPDIVLIVVAAPLLLALCLLVVLLARERGARRRLEEAFAQRASISAFEAGEIYTLLGNGGADIDGETHHFGVVRLESGDVRAFCTTEDTSVLGVGDTFSSVRGRPVRLDSAPGAGVDAEAATVAATVAAAEMSEPAEEEGDDDRTRIFQPAAAPVVDDGFGQPYLEVVAGPDMGKRYTLDTGTARVGRDAANEVALSDTSTSRVHCHVGFAEGRYRLRDNHSTNGTLLNGDRTVESPLDFDDRIQVAETELRFSCDGFDLKDTDPKRAITAFERCLQRNPDLLPALRLLAFLLERDVARRGDADPVWRRIAELEGSD